MFCELTTCGQLCKIQKTILLLSFVLTNNDIDDGDEDEGDDSDSIWWCLGIPE